MKPEITIDGHAYDLIYDSLTLQSSLSRRISTAEFEVRSTLYTPAINDEVQIIRGAVEFQNCAILPAAAMGGKATYLNNYFGGYVAILYTRIEGLSKIYHISAQDYNVRATRKLITETYTTQTLKQIVDDLFGTYLPEFDASEVEDTVATISIEWTRTPLDLCLDELGEIFGKVWYIRHDKKVQMFTAGGTAAPFILSTSPFGTAYVPYTHRQSPREDGSSIVKKVTVVGDTTVPVVETRTKGDADDDEYEDKYIDNNINTAAWAQSVGDAIITSRGSAKMQGSAECLQEGLVIGQNLKVVDERLGIDDDFIIRSVNLSMDGQAQERVSVEYGDEIEDLETKLTRIKRLEQKE